MRCFERNRMARTVSRRRAFLEAERWLFKDSRGAGPFSFENVSEMLDADPNRLGRALSQSRQRSLRGERGTLRIRAKVEHFDREKYGVSPKNTAGWLAWVQELAPVVGTEGTIEVNLFATAADAAGAGGRPQAE